MRPTPRIHRSRLVLELLFALAFAGMCAVSTYGYLIDHSIPPIPHFAGPEPRPS